MIFWPVVEGQQYEEWKTDFCERERTPEIVWAHVEEDLLVNVADSGRTLMAAILRWK